MSIISTVSQSISQKVQYFAAHSVDRTLTNESIHWGAVILIGCYAHPGYAILTHCALTAARAGIHEVYLAYNRPQVVSPDEVDLRLEQMRGG